MRVIHTVKYQYGSYSGETKVVCDENDDHDTIKALVAKRKQLNFLSMAYYSIKVIATNNLD